MEIWKGLGKKVLFQGLKQTKQYGNWLDMK